MVNTLRSVLIILNSLQQMHSKLLQKKGIQNIAEATNDLNRNKIADAVAK